ncbi:MAG: SUMF1/EgtB/PvdO family nonheme iron enzyme [Bdellovibrionota bacterium]
MCQLVNFKKSFTQLLLFFELIFIPFLDLELIFAGTEKVTLQEQNKILLEKIAKTHNLTEEHLKKLTNIFKTSGYIGQGNPKLTVHPMSVQKCHEKLKSEKISYENIKDETICGGKYMAPLYNVEKSTKEKAKVCIDKFEFPDIPCEYPVVWVKAREAAEICQAIGKRICDAHEWEGACAGDLREPDYDFTLAKKMDFHSAIKKMRYQHNLKEGKNKSWSYGPKRRTGICAANGSKTEGCGGEGWAKCGSNTYPAGAFPECKSSFNVYDIHGNAAEHMNLPILPEQMASKKNSQLGYTEMKGSWFIFDKYKAHKDYCRWRAPFWHGTRVMDSKSHHNYHLGFRCCKDL